MKKKQVIRILASVMVFCLFSGEVFAAAPGAVDTDKMMLQTEAEMDAKSEVGQNAVPETDEDEDAEGSETDQNPVSEDGESSVGVDASASAKTEEEQTEGADVLDPIEDDSLVSTVDVSDTVLVFTTQPEAEERAVQVPENLTYTYNYVYQAPDKSIVLSPSSLTAADVVELAYPIIFEGEGNYTTVTPDDNGSGSLSIGKIQWHGNRALYLMREIVETDPKKAYTLLGKDLYEEVTSSRTSWSSYVPNTEETRLIKTFLQQMPKSAAVQDKMAKADIAGYVNYGMGYGLRNAMSLIYFADLYNQSPVRAKEIVKAVVEKGICKNYKDITLNEIYLSALTNSVMNKSQYMSRRTRVYKQAAALGYPYCNDGDSLMPCVLKGFSSEVYVGEAWLQWALNSYAEENLTITDKYDAETKEAIKRFQEKQGLKADGQAGADTLKAMASLIMESGVYAPAQSVKKDAVITVTKTTWEVNDTDGKFSLGAKSNHSEAPFAYKSSNTKIVTVASDGAVTPVGPGTATVTVSQAATSGYHAAAKTVTIKVYDNDPTAYNTPTTTLTYKKSGMKKSDIQWLQAALNVVNQAGLLVDGEYGSGTDKAVKEFQKKVGTVADGEVGSNTRSILINAISVINGTPAVTTTGSTSGVTVKWSTIAGATGYNVYRRPINGSWAYIRGLGSTATSYTDSTGTVGTTYYYTARAYYKKGSLLVYSKFLSNITGAKTKQTVTTSKYPVPTRTLKQGSKGNDVKWMQDGINKVLGSKMPVDGEYGSNTAKYVKQFQQKYGLTADGIFGAASRKKLQSLYPGTSGSTGGSNSSNSTNNSANNSSNNTTNNTAGNSTSKYPVPTRTLKQGSTGNDVKWMQDGINKVLGSKMPVDGEYGSNTAKYVKQFQQKYGLTADGIFGAASRKKLQSLYPGTSGSTGGSNSSNSTNNSANNSSNNTTNNTAGNSTSKYPVPTRTLKQGSTGNDVKWMQDGINKVLGSKMPVDGEYGSNTAKYVKQFQQKYGLTVDGLFGAASRKKLQTFYK